MSTLHIHTHQTGALIDTSRVRVDSLGRNLQLRGQALQLADAASKVLLTTISVQEQGDPSWIADQTIAIEFNGTDEIAIFMVDEPTFDYYQAKSTAADYGVDTNIITKSIQFVQFTGANLLDRY